MAAPQVPVTILDRESSIFPEWPRQCRLYDTTVQEASQTLHRVPAGLLATVIRSAETPDLITLVRLVYLIPFGFAG